MPSSQPALILTSLLVMTSFVGVTTQCTGEGATEDLRTVVKGRCINYKILNPSVICNETHGFDCAHATDLFVTAFAGQPACHVVRSHYDDFLAFTRHETAVDESIFWHEVYDLVHRYSEGGARRTTLEDTLTGYMVDGLRFCSSPLEEGGIGGPTTAFCPSYHPTPLCLFSAESSFWSAASMDFASKARGAITIMLNASVTEAFSESSYLGKYEIPNLVTNVVTRADIWMMHVPGDEIRETCDSASVTNLTSILLNKNIPSTCTENPRDVLWLLCWDHKDHPECQALVTSGATSASAVETSLVLMISLWLMMLLDAVM